MNLMEYLGSSVELKKLDDALGIMKGSVFISKVFPNALIVSTPDILMMSETLDVMCGENFLNDGNFLRSGVLAVAEHSYGTFLAIGNEGWKDMRVTKSRSVMEDLLVAANKRFKSEAHIQLDITKMYNRAEYLIENAASLDMNKKKVSGRNKDEVFIFHDDHCQYYAPIRGRVLKGLNDLGAQVWLKIMPEYEAPFFFFMISELSAYGVIMTDERLVKESGPKTTEDGRSLSAGGCLLSWLSIESAIENIEKDANLIQGYDKGGSGADLVDSIIRGNSYNGSSVALRIGVSTLRWNGLTDDEIALQISDIEDHYYNERIRKIDAKSRDLVDTFDHTRNLRGFLYQYDQIAREYASISSRILSKYPGVTVDCEGLDIMRAIAEQNDPIPF